MFVYHCACAPMIQKESLCEFPNDWRRTKHQAWPCTILFTNVWPHMPHISLWFRQSEDYNIARWSNFATAWPEKHQGSGLARCWPWLNPAESPSFITKVEEGWIKWDEEIMFYYLDWFWDIDGPIHFHATTCSMSHPSLIKQPEDGWIRRDKEQSENESLVFFILVYYMGWFWDREAINVSHHNMCNVSLACKIHCEVYSRHAYAIPCSLSWRTLRQMFWVLERTVFLHTKCGTQRSGRSQSVWLSLCLHHCNLIV